MSNKVARKLEVVAEYECEAVNNGWDFPTTEDDMVMNKTR